MGLYKFLGKTALERGLYRRVNQIFLSLNQNRVEVKSMLGEIVL